MKLLVLTDEGEKLRVEITERMAEPPPPIAALSEEDQRELETSSSARSRPAGIER